METRNRNRTLSSFCLKILSGVGLASLLVASACGDLDDRAGDRLDTRTQLIEDDGLQSNVPGRGGAVFDRERIAGDPPPSVDEDIFGPLAGADQPAAGSFDEGAAAPTADYADTHLRVPEPENALPEQPLTLDGLAVGGHVVQDLFVHPSGASSVFGHMEGDESLLWTLPGVTPDMLGLNNEDYGLHHTSEEDRTFEALALGEHLPNARAWRSHSARARLETAISARGVDWQHESETFGTLTFTHGQQALVSVVDPQYGEAVGLPATDVGEWVSDHEFLARTYGHAEDLYAFDEYGVRFVHRIDALPEGGAQDYVYLENMSVSSGLVLLVENDTLAIGETRQTQGIIQVQPSDAHIASMPIMLPPRAWDSSEEGATTWWAWDGNDPGAHATYEVTRIDETTYELALVVDSAWLNSQERVFPIFVDPTSGNPESSLFNAPTAAQPGLGSANDFAEPINPAHTNYWLQTWYNQTMLGPAISRGSVFVGLSVYRTTGSLADSSYRTVLNTPNHTFRNDLRIRADVRQQNNPPSGAWQNLRFEPFRGNFGSFQATASDRWSRSCSNGWNSGSSTRYCNTDTCCSNTNSGTWFTRYDQWANRWVGQYNGHLAMNNRHLDTAAQDAVFDGNTLVVEMSFTNNETHSTSTRHRWVWCSGNCSVQATNAGGGSSSGSLLNRHPLTRLYFRTPAFRANDVTHRNPIASQSNPCGGAIPCQSGGRRDVVNMYRFEIPANTSATFRTFNSVAGDRCEDTRSSIWIASGGGQVCPTNQYIQCRCQSNCGQPGQPPCCSTTTTSTQVCTATGAAGYCPNTTCRNAICNADFWCCTYSWDSICANAAASSPSCTETVTTCSPAPNSGSDFVSSNPTDFCVGGFVDSSVFQGACELPETPACADSNFTTTNTVSNTRLGGTGGNLGSRTCAEDEVIIGYRANACQFCRSFNFFGRCFLWAWSSYYICDMEAQCAQLVPNSNAPTGYTLTPTSTVQVPTNNTRKRNWRPARSPSSAWNTLMCPWEQGYFSTGTSIYNGTSWFGNYVTNLGHRCSQASLNANGTLSHQNTTGYNYMSGSGFRNAGSTSTAGCPNGSVKRIHQVRTGAIHDAIHNVCTGAEVVSRPGGVDIDGCGTYELSVSAVPRTVYVRIDSRGNRSWQPFLSYRMDVTDAEPPELRATDNIVEHVFLDWDLVGGVDGYLVQRQDGAGNWVTIGYNAGASNITFTDTTAGAPGPPPPLDFRVNGEPGRIVISGEGVGEGEEGQTHIYRVVPQVANTDMIPSNNAQGNRAAIIPDAYEVYAANPANGYNNVAFVGEVSHADAQSAWSVIYTPVVALEMPSLSAGAFLLAQMNAFSRAFVPVGMQSASAVEGAEVRFWTRARYQNPNGSGTILGPVPQATCDQLEPILATLPPDQHPECNNACDVVNFVLDFDGEPPQRCRLAQGTPNGFQFAGATQPGSIRYRFQRSSTLHGFGAAPAGGTISYAGSPWTGVLASPAWNDNGASTDGQWHYYRARIFETGFGENAANQVVTSPGYGRRIAVSAPITEAPTFVSRTPESVRLRGSYPNAQTLGSPPPERIGFCFAPVSANVSCLNMERGAANVTCVPETAGPQFPGIFSYLATNTFQPGTNYRYRAYSYLSNLENDPDYPANLEGRAYAANCVDFLTLPDRPVIQATTNNPDHVTVTWTSVPTATSYDLQFRESGSGWQGVPDCANPNTSTICVDTTAPAGTTATPPGGLQATQGTLTTGVRLTFTGVAGEDGAEREYRVSARNSTGLGRWSASAFGRRSALPLTYQFRRNGGAWQNLPATETAPGSGVFTWLDTSVPMGTISFAGTDPLSASQGTFVDRIELNVAGASAAPGDSVNYEVRGRATPCTGTDCFTAPTPTVAGFRGVGDLLYRYARVVPDNLGIDTDPDTQAGFIGTLLVSLSGANPSSQSTVDDNTAPDFAIPRWYRVRVTAAGATMSETNWAYGFTDQPPGAPLGGFPSADQLTTDGMRWSWSAAAIPGATSYWWNTGGFSTSGPPASLPPGFTETNDINVVLNGQGENQCVRFGVAGENLAGFGPIGANAEATLIRAPTAAAIDLGTDAPLRVQVDASDVPGWGGGADPHCGTNQTAARVRYQQCNVVAGACSCPAGGWSSWSGWRGSPGDFVFSEAESGCFRVDVQYRNQNGVESDITRVDTGLWLPPIGTPVVNFTTASHSTSRLQWLWGTGSLQDATGYEYASVPGPATTPGASPSVVTFGHDDTSYAESGLSANRCYSAFVRGTNPAGAGPWSTTDDYTRATRVRRPFETRYLGDTYDRAALLYDTSSNRRYAVAGTDNLAEENTTIEFWFRPDHNSNFSGEAVLLSKRHAPGTGFHVYLDNGTLRFDWGGADWNTGFDGFERYQWYHVALTRSPSGRSAFINGEFIGSTGNAGGDATSASALHIGQDALSASGYVRGHMYDLRFWSEDLSADPQRIFFLQFTSDVSGQDNLMAHWPMNDGSGSTLANVAAEARGGDAMRFRNGSANYTSGWRNMAFFSLDGSARASELRVRADRLPNRWTDTTACLHADDRTAVMYEVRACETDNAVELPTLPSPTWTRDTELLIDTRGHHCFDVRMRHRNRDGRAEVWTGWARYYDVDLEPPIDFRQVGATRTTVTVRFTDNSASEDGFQIKALNTGTSEPAETTGVNCSWVTLDKPGFGPGPDREYECTVGVFGTRHDNRNLRWFWARAVLGIPSQSSPVFSGDYTEALAAATLPPQPTSCGGLSGDVSEPCTAWNPVADDLVLSRVDCAFPPPYPGIHPENPLCDLTFNLNAPERALTMQTGARLERRVLGEPTWQPILTNECLSGPGEDPICDTYAGRNIRGYGVTTPASVILWTNDLEGRHTQEGLVYGETYEFRVRFYNMTGFATDWTTFQFRVGCEIGGNGLGVCGRGVPFNNPWPSAGGPNGPEDPTVVGGCHYPGREDGQERCDAEDWACTGSPFTGPDDEPVRELCYDGPEATAGQGSCPSGAGSTCVTYASPLPQGGDVFGVGTCRLGVATCGEYPEGSGNILFGPCEGQVLPVEPTPFDICTGEDNSCSGEIDDLLQPIEQGLFCGCPADDPFCRDRGANATLLFSPSDEEVRVDVGGVPVCVNGSPVCDGELGYSCSDVFYNSCGGCVPFAPGQAPGDPAGELCGIIECGPDPALGLAYNDPNIQVLDLSDSVGTECVYAAGPGAPGSACQVGTYACPEGISLLCEQAVWPYLDPMGRPSFFERCDGMDNNCDGRVDADSRRAEISFVANYPGVPSFSYWEGLDDNGQAGDCDVVIGENACNAITVTVENIGCNEIPADAMIRFEEQDADGNTTIVFSSGIELGVALAAGPSCDENEFAAGGESVTLTICHQSPVRSSGSRLFFEMVDPAEDNTCFSEASAALFEDIPLAPCADREYCDGYDNTGSGQANDASDAELCGDFALTCIELPVPVNCTDDSQCSAGICNYALGRCFACVGTALDEKLDCNVHGCGEGSVCEPITGNCYAGCLEDGDCPRFEFCGPAGTCIDPDREASYLPDLPRVPGFGDAGFRRADLEPALAGDSLEDRGPRLGPDSDGGAFGNGGCAHVPLSGNELPWVMGALLALGLLWRRREHQRG